MSGRILLDIFDLYQNGNVLQDITCSLCIQNNIDFEEYLAVPFPEKVIFDLPNFNGSIIMTFKHRGKNLCQSKLAILELLDRDSNQFPTFSFESNSQDPSFFCEALVRAVYPKEMLLSGLHSLDIKEVTNVFESKSLVGSRNEGSPIHTVLEEQKSSLPTLVTVMKVINRHEIQYIEKNIYETIIHDESHHEDLIKISKETTKIVKELGLYGEVVHQTKVVEEKEFNKSAKDHIPLVNRQYESLTEIDDEENIVEVEDDYRETHFMKDQENPSYLLALTDGYHTNYTAEGGILHREEYKTQEDIITDDKLLSSNKEVQYGHSQASSEVIAQKRAQAQLLLSTLENNVSNRQANPELAVLFQNLKAVIGDIVKTSESKPSSQEDGSIPLQRQSLERSVSSPVMHFRDQILRHESQASWQQQSQQLQPIYHQPYHQKDQALNSELHSHPPKNLQANSQRKSDNFDSSNIMVEASYPVEEDKGKSYGPRLLPGEEHGMSYAPKIPILHDPLQSSRSIEDKSPNFNRLDDKGLNTQPFNLSGRKKDQSEKRNRSKSPNKNTEYLLNLKDTIALAATAHVEDALAKDIIFQMSRNKKRVTPIMMKKSIALSSKDELKITAKNYFQDSCSRRYLHYFMPFSKNLFLLNLNKKFEDNIGMETFQHIELAIDFDISPYSRSLITPTGLIFLIAGKTEQQSATTDDTIGSCHLYHYNSHSLIEKATMTTLKRKEFGLQYFNKNLFVIGGVVNGQITNACERYDVRTNEWVQIAHMERAVKDVSLCVFGNRYIFRFFGVNSHGTIDQTIERFDAIRNKWQNITPNYKNKVNDIYLPLCYAIAEDTIYIFGGRNINGFEATKCEGYLVKVDDKKSSLKVEISRTRNQIPGFTGLLNPNCLFVQDNVLYTMREGNFNT